MATSGFETQRWLPQTWLPDARTMKLIKEVQFINKAPDELSPVIQEFKNLIEGDPVIRMGFQQMFDQVPQRTPYDNDPINRPQV